MQKQKTSSFWLTVKSDIKAGQDTAPAADATAAAAPAEAAPAAAPAAASEDNGSICLKLG